MSVLFITLQQLKINIRSQTVPPKRHTRSELNKHPKVQGETMVKKELGKLKMELEKVVAERYCLKRKRFFTL